MSLESPLMRTKSQQQDEAPAGLRFYAVRSADGTRLCAWTNGADGPPVLLCNGLGTSPYAWPALLEPDCGVRVISWNHRGIGGSDRPDDIERVGMEAFLEDAIAVMDDAGLSSCVVMGWSMGVNVAFELINCHPERVDGILAVGGVPGDTFNTMLAPLHLPRPLAKAALLGFAHVAKITGRAATPVTNRIPWNRVTTTALRYSGFMMSSSRHEEVREAVREFMAADVDWYAHLALHASRHDRVSLSHIAVPVTLIAGRWDVLAGMRDVRTAAERIDDSRYVELSGSHFLPLEQPEEIHAELLDLIARAGRTQLHR